MICTTKLLRSRELSTTCRGWGGCDEKKVLVSDSDGGDGIRVSSPDEDDGVDGGAGEQLLSGMSAGDEDAVAGTDEVGDPADRNKYRVPDSEKDQKKNTVLSSDIVHACNSGPARVHASYLPRAACTSPSPRAVCAAVSSARRD